MENIVRHVYEPSFLELAWQAPEGAKIRKRFAVGKLIKTGRDVSLHYYSDTSDVTEARALGYQGYPAFSLAQAIHTKDVLAAFMRRLPPRQRPDFGAYLSALRLSANYDISDFSLLAYSEAKLPSDGFSLVDTLTEKGLPCEFLFEVAGHRYTPTRLTSADIGTDVVAEHEPNNPKDPGAVVLKVRGNTIGYINRLQAPVVLEWLQRESVHFIVDKLNGKPDRPRVFVFMQVTEKQSSNFLPAAQIALPSVR